MPVESKVRTKGELEEFRRCRKSALYFIKNYAFIKDPIRGIIKFDLFDYQEKLFEKWKMNKYNINHKPRQMGISWAAAGYALWLANFYRNKTVKIISENENKAIAFLDKCKVIYGELPAFLKSYQTSNTTEISFSQLDKNLVELENGSLIASLPASPQAGRSDSLSLLIMDEAAFVPWAEDIWAAAFPTLSTGGKAILISTANGVGNLFHEMWTKALNKENDFEPLQLKWDDYPGRGKEWLEEQRKNLPPLKFAQEVMGDFIQSGSPVFDRLFLNKTGKKQKPVPGRRYLIGADPAEGGLRGDFSVVQVIDPDTGDQVLVEKGKWAPDVFARKIHGIWERYSGLVGVERNNHGHAVIMKLLDFGVEVYRHTDGKYGFPTNSLTKPQIIDDLEESLRTGTVKLSDDTTIGELTHYQYQENGSMNAPKGFHDDHVMSLAIAWRMRSAMNQSKKICDFSDFSDYGEINGRKSIIPHRIGLSA
jgi:hypothetical protein